MSARFKGPSTLSDRPSITSSARADGAPVGLLFLLFTRARRSCSAVVDSLTRTSRRSANYSHGEGSKGVSRELPLSTPTMTHEVAGKDKYCANKHLDPSARE